MPRRRRTRLRPLGDRGETYADLADATFRGVLNPQPLGRQHRFREVYSVEFDDWNRMVADLFAQVVLDARTIDEAARVLGISWAEVEMRTHWALNLGKPTSPSYVVVAGQWEDMKRQVLAQVLEECGSIRAASTRLRVPRSTLQAWAKKLNLAGAALKHVERR